VGERFNSKELINMIKDFFEEKAKKEGKLTPKALLESTLDHIDEVEYIVVTMRCKNGEILTGWSEMNHLTMLGLMEAGKVQIFQNMYEEE
jgi:hypothetical protein